MLPKVCAWITVITFTKIYLNFTYAFKCYHQKCRLSWPHFRWPTLYVVTCISLHRHSPVLAICLICGLEITLMPYIALHRYFLRIHAPVGRQTRYCKRPSLCPLHLNCINRSRHACSDATAEKLIRTNKGTGNGLSEWNSIRMFWRKPFSFR